MIRRPPRSTRTATLFPYTTLFRSGDALAQLLALLADHNRRASGELGGPVRDSAELTPHRAGNPTRVGSKILVGSDIDDDRASRRADQAHKLVEGNRVVCRHSASSCMGGRDASDCRLMGRRWEERRVVKECVSTVRLRGATYSKKKKKQIH